MTIHHINHLNRHPNIPAPTYLDHTGIINVAFPPKENCDLWFHMRSTDPIRSDVIVTGRSLEVPSYNEYGVISPEIFKTVELLPSLRSTHILAERYFIKSNTGSIPYRVKYYSENWTHSLLYLKNLGRFHNALAHSPLHTALSMIDEQVWVPEIQNALHDLKLVPYHDIFTEQITNTEDTSYFINNIILDTLSHPNTTSVLKYATPHLIPEDVSLLKYPHSPWPPSAFKWNFVRNPLVYDGQYFNTDLLEDVFIQQDPYFSNVAMTLDRLPLTDVNFVYTLLKGKEHLELRSALNRYKSHTRMQKIDVSLISEYIKSSLHVWIHRNFDEHTECEVHLIKTFNDEMFVIRRPLNDSQGPATVIHTDIALLHLCGFGAVFS